MADPGIPPPSPTAEKTSSSVSSTLQELRPSTEMGPTVGPSAVGSCFLSPLSVCHHLYLLCFVFFFFPLTKTRTTSWSLSLSLSNSQGQSKVILYMQEPQGLVFPSQHPLKIKTNEM